MLLIGRLVQHNMLRFVVLELAIREAMGPLESFGRESFSDRVF
jgi:hypothetical protein